ncbi:Hypothetical protein CINCED_3A021198 [Cinara cedri]|uniref:Uncharacterized protein n=1 Tax=Cinara cedri TaxID=506608 RepID=A0A5E4MZG9_9HEMI|nr:Hypothetical protein CINCED_3A021198 [Cinara cedri]
MSINNNLVDGESQCPNKKNLPVLIETTKAALLTNENILESILKDESCSENSQMEYQINNCFGLRCKLDDYQDELKELEFKYYYQESANTLMDFVTIIPRDRTDLWPEALVVVTSEEVKQIYMQLFQRFALDNVIVVTIDALTGCNFQVPLSNVKTALLDGSREAYAEFAGSESVRLVISAHIPPGWLFVICNDAHRQECFQKDRE